MPKITPPPVSVCDLCGDPIEADDELYLLEGQIVCVLCLGDYAAIRFESDKLTGRELARSRHPDQFK